MENLRKGDVVEISSKDTTYTLRATTGCRYIVSEKPRNGIVKVDLSMFLRLNDVKKIGESQMQYEESNRYKLAQAIKKTGLKVGELSIAVNGNTNYFGNYHNKSRFNERGDISEARLNELLTDLAFAEREVLGIGDKTVEEPNQETIDAINAECESDVFLTAQDLANSVKEKPTSNKPLFIGASVVIFIAIILFILNNYLQVV